MTRRAMTRAPGIALLGVTVLLVAGCAKSNPQVDTRTNGGATPATNPLATRGTATVATALQPGCHNAPASTAPGVRGGGEIICDGLAGAPSSPGSPGNAPTTFAPTTIPTGPQPDADHGVARVTLGGSPCSKSHPDQPCIMILELLKGTATITRIDAPGITADIVVVPQSDPTRQGSGSMLLAPGTYRLIGKPDGPDRVCAEQTIAVVAEQTTDAHVMCTAP